MDEESPSLSTTKTWKRTAKPIEAYAIWMNGPTSKGKGLCGCEIQADIPMHINRIGLSL